MENGNDGPVVDLVSSDDEVNVDSNSVISIEIIKLIVYSKACEIIVSYIRRNKWGSHCPSDIEQARQLPSEQFHA
jgi:hypothetical protein